MPAPWPDAAKTTAGVLVASINQSSNVVVCRGAAARSPQGALTQLHQPTGVFAEGVCIWQRSAAGPRLSVCSTSQPGEEHWPGSVWCQTLLDSRPAEPESSEEGATFVTLQEVVVNSVVKKHNRSRNNRRLASLTGCKRSKQLFPGVLSNNQQQQYHNP